MVKSSREIRAMICVGIMDPYFSTNILVVLLLRLVQRCSNQFGDICKKKSGPLRLVK